MSFSGKVGETLYLSDSSDYRHLRVILTIPNDDGDIVVVNFTGARYDRNNAIVFTPKDWSFFKKDTTVRYSDAYLVNHKNLLNTGKQNPGQLGDVCPQDIVDRVVVGAFISRDTPGKIIRELQNNYPALYKKHYDT